MFQEINYFYHIFQFLFHFIYRYIYKNHILFKKKIIRIFILCIINIAMLTNARFFLDFHHYFHQFTSSSIDFLNFNFLMLKYQLFILIIEYIIFFSLLFHMMIIQIYLQQYLLINLDLYTQFCQLFLSRYTFFSIMAIDFP